MVSGELFHGSGCIMLMKISARVTVDFGGTAHCGCHKAVLRANRSLNTMNAVGSCLLISFLVSATFTTVAQVQGPSAAPRKPASAVDFEQARTLLAQGKLDEAAALTKERLAQRPHSVVGLTLLGVIYDQQGKYDEAIALFQKALTVEPNSVDALINMALSFAAQGKTEPAEQTLRKAVRLRPTNRTANYNLGAMLLDQRKPKEALRYLRRIASPDPATRLLTVRAYLESGMVRAGLTEAETLSRNSAKDARAHFSLGVLLASSRQYRQAAYEFALANSLQPGDFEILHDLGQAYLMSGQFAKAHDTLNEAMRLRPNSAETLYALAQTLAEMRKEMDALELLVRARKLAPTNTNIIFLMARLSMKQSFFEDTIELLKEGLKLDPRRADFHAALGESYFTVGKVDQALEEFKTLIALDPSPRSYVFMGLCYRHLGQYDEAKRYLNQSLSADPNNIPALFNLGFIARKQNDYAQAEQYLTRALRLDRDYPEALFELGSVKMDQKKFEEAIPLFRHCAEVSPRPGEAYYKLALAERSLRQFDAAQRDMDVFKTLSKNPQPAPYPLQHFFDYLDRRSTLSPSQQNESDLRELQADVQQNPDRPRSLYLLAEALLKLGRKDEAIQTLQHLEDVSGGDFRTELNTGVLLGRYRLYSDAIRYFQAAGKANPASDEAQYNLAEAYFQSGRYQEALQSLLQVSSDGQKDGSYLGLIGDVYTRLGRYADATQSLKEAVTRSPDNEQYYAALALVQLRTGGTEDAERTTRSGLARIPDSGVLHWSAGVIAVARGRERDGENFLKKATELSPSRETFFATLGILYYEEKRVADAREVLKRCMEMFPQGALDFQRINATLEAATASGQPKASEDISPEARKEFCQLALAMHDQER